MFSKISSLEADEILTDKLCSPNSNIQMSHTLTIVRLIVESTLKLINNTRCKIIGNAIFEMKGVT